MPVPRQKYERSCTCKLQFSVEFAYFCYFSIGFWNGLDKYAIVCASFYYRTHNAGSDYLTLCHYMLIVIIISYILFYYIKVIRQFGCLQKICWLGRQPGEQPKDMQCREKQLVVVRSTTGCSPVCNPSQPEVCWKCGFFLVQFRNCIFNTGNYYCCSLQNKTFKLLE